MYKTSSIDLILCSHQKIGAIKEIVCMHFGLKDEQQAKQSID